jgi:hypothetical protein
MDAKGWWQYDAEKRVGGGEMPLSEHEQKILSDLEGVLSRQDPRFARLVSGTNAVARFRRWIRLGIAGCFVGAAVLIAFFTMSVLVGLAGLAVLVGSSLLIARGVDGLRHPPSG